MIGIIDAGLGNIGSLLSMFDRIGADARALCHPEALSEASQLILPGVGAFDQGMMRLHDGGWVEPMRIRVQEDRVPLLGICLGMQLLGRSSEEGSAPGLGWVPARTIRFDLGANPEGLRIPHMGWNEIQPCAHDKLLNLPADEFGSPPRFYFAHSYHIVCDDPDDIAATAVHGIRFTAALCHDNIHGVQFHPEKSHRWGKLLLARFAGLSSAPA